MPKNKQPIVLSLQQALTAGYTLAIEDGNEHCFSIEGLKESELEEFRQLQPNTCYWLLDQQPKHFTTNPDELRELLGEVADNQGEFNDEDGELKQLVDDLYREQPALFEALSLALNEKWSKHGFCMQSDFQIDFTL
jgi:hypothetical protein